MKLRSKILLAIVIAFGLIQFIRPSYPEKAVNPSNDLILATNPPAEVATIIQNTCYDCHSYEYSVPWYGKFAPGMWILSDHIHEGLEHLNFSDWKSYSRKQMAHKMEECAEEVGEGEMPLAGYKVMHAHARLSDEDRAMLVEWFESKSR